MVARYAGASLGLLAFAIAIAGGLLAQNPATVTLSRGIVALFIFFAIGLLLGTAAQFVLAEYEKQQVAGLGELGPDDSTNAIGDGVDGARANGVSQADPLEQAYDEEEAVVVPAAIEEL